MFTRIGSLGERVLGVFVPRMEAQALCSGAVQIGSQCTNSGCALWFDQRYNFFRCPNGSIQQVSEGCGSCAD